MQDELISRQAAIDAFERFIHELGIKDEPYNYGEMALSVQNVPSVNPQYTEDEIQKMQDLEQAEIQRAYEIGKAEEPKTGHWIQTQEKDDAEPFILWECSCCHKEFRSVVHKVSNYCPNCGVKMEV